MKLMNNNWGFLPQSGALIQEGLTPFLWNFIERT
jgi:hypothetical protein